MTEETYCWIIHMDMIKIGLLVGFICHVLNLKPLWEKSRVWDEMHLIHRRTKGGMKEYSPPSL